MMTSDIVDSALEHTGSPNIVVDIEITHDPSPHSHYVEQPLDLDVTGVVDEIVKVGDISEVKIEHKSRVKTFWLVWSMGGLISPRVRHSKEKDARRAAKAMALKYPKQRFYVLKSVVQYRVADPRVIENTW